MRLLRRKTLVMKEKDIENLLAKCKVSKSIRFAVHIASTYLSNGTVGVRLAGMRNRCNEGCKLRRGSVDREASKTAILRWVIQTDRISANSMQIKQSFGSNDHNSTSSRKPVRMNA